LPRQTAWNFYFHAYKIGDAKLLTWWIAGVRKDKFQDFAGYEKMCKAVSQISDFGIAKHESVTKNSIHKR